MTLSKAYSQYGASMGRRSTLCQNTFSGTFKALEAHLDEDGYDSGGAYWGTGTPLWRLTADDGEQVELWLRAEGFEGLVKLVGRLYPYADLVKELGSDRLDEFVLNYLFTALWSSTTEGEQPMDEAGLDLAEETLATFRKDCEKFLEKADLILPNESDSALAHDFWLTRNGHGAGFWDGDYSKEIGEKLTALSKEFGECYLYVGDDGKVYQG
jgi:hypothetical protein